MRFNPILKTDSYKPSHFKQLDPRVRTVFSHMLPRGGPFSHVITFGALRAVVGELFSDPVTKHDIDEAEDFLNEHMGPGCFARQDWEYIVNKYGGFIPLRVRAVTEGLRVPVKNVVLTSENLDPKLPWLTNYFETPLYPWYPYTIATLSNGVRQTILRFLHRNGTPELIDFKLHDFGYRGTTDSWSAVQAAFGGLAHLGNFKGTDTMPACLLAREYYRCRMAGFSIPASEHSTITSWTSEQEAFDNFLNQFPTGPAACVSDTRDIYNACDYLWGQVFRERVLARVGFLVVRPDSGNPTEVVMKCLRILDKRFGSSYNQKNYRVLDPHVRLIWGDGIDPQGIDMILSVMDINGYSADNIGFGMGGGLLQKVNRDTMKWKFAASAVTLDDGTVRDIFKSPITDNGKISVPGRLSLYVTGDGHYYTAPEGGSPSGTDVMQTLYDCTPDGPYFGMNDTLDVIRERIRSYDFAPAPTEHKPDCRAQHDDEEATCRC